MFKRQQIGLAIVLGALVALPARAAEPDRYLPDDAEIVLHVNVSQIVDAPLVKKHCLQLIKNYLQSKPEVQTVLNALGFDPLKDVTSLTATSPTTNDTEKLCLIVHGKFDLSKFHAQAADAAQKHADHLKVHTIGGNRVYEIRDPSLGEDKPLYVGLIDATTLVASGVKDHVLTAFGKASAPKKSALRKDVLDLIAKADGKQSIWLVAPGAPLSKSDLAGDERAKKSLEKIESISAGVTIQDVLLAEIHIATKGPEDAKTLTEELGEGLNQAKGLLQILAGNQARLSPLVTLLGNIKVSANGNTASLRIEASAELLEKLLKQE